MSKETYQRIVVEAWVKSGCPADKVKFDVPRYGTINLCEAKIHIKSENFIRTEPNRDYDFYIEFDENGEIQVCSENTDWDVYISNECFNAIAKTKAYISYVKSIRDTL